MSHVKATSHFFSSIVLNFPCNMLYANFLKQAQNPYKINHSYSQHACNKTRFSLSGRLQLLMFYSLCPLQGGPSARSCHKVCLDYNHKQMFTLGRYLDPSMRTPDMLKVSPQSSRTPLLVGSSTQTGMACLMQKRRIQSSFRKQ